MSDNHLKSTHLLSDGVAVGFLPNRRQRHGSDGVLRVVSDAVLLVPRSAGLVRVDWRFRRNQLVAAHLLATRVAYRFSYDEEGHPIVWKGTTTSSHFLMNSMPRPTLIFFS